MWRVSGGWSKILHVVGGIIQYSVTHLGKRVRINEVEHGAEDDCRRERLDAAGRSIPGSD